MFILKGRSCLYQTYLINMFFWSPWFQKLSHVIYSMAKKIPRSRCDLPVKTALQAQWQMHYLAPLAVGPSDNGMLELLALGFTRETEDLPSKWQFLQ